MENQVNTVSIYTAEGCEVIRDCFIIVLDNTPLGSVYNWPAGLCLSKTETGTYKHVAELACVARAGQYHWFRNNSEITNLVTDWLEHNEYTWPLDREQQAQFILTFL